jgi:hypothetical protein
LDPGAKLGPPDTFAVLGEHDVEEIRMVMHGSYSIE